MNFRGGYDVELIHTPEADAMNQVLLRATRQLAEEEQKQILTLLSKAWNEGFNALREELEKQKADPSYPINRSDPYKAMMER